MTKETLHFIATYHEIDKAFAEKFVSLLEEKYSDINQCFAFKDAKHKYRFILCKDVEEYIGVTGKRKEDYQSWMVGHSNSDSHVISILSPRVVTDRSEADMEKVAVHELVHMIFDDATGVSEDDCEVWVAEGIAILYANQTEREYISETEFPAIKDLSGFDNFVDNQGYDYAGIYVRYFIKTYGFTKFIELYCKECEWQELIYDGFEGEAVTDYFL